jgi:uncharacterized protein
VIYLDASALVTFVTRRPNYQALRAYLSGFPAVDLVTSTIGFIETVRACDSVGAFPNLLARLLREYGELELTAEVRDRASHLPGLRALDAIHVATAELLEDDLVALVTYDRGMAKVATERALPVVSPGDGG